MCGRRESIFVGDVPLKESEGSVKVNKVMPKVGDIVKVAKEIPEHDLRTVDDAFVLDMEKYLGTKLTVIEIDKSCSAHFYVKENTWGWCPYMLDPITPIIKEKRDGSKSKRRTQDK